MRAGTQSRIFGAVTADDRRGDRQAVRRAIDRRHVMLEEPIKHLGEYTVPLRASADVTGEIKVSVEAETKAGRGKASKAAAKGKPGMAEAPPVPAEAAGPTDVERAIEEADVHEKYEHVEQDIEA